MGWGCFLRGRKSDGSQRPRPGVKSCPKSQEPGSGCELGTGKHKVWTQTEQDKSGSHDPSIQGPCLKDGVLRNERGQLGLNAPRMALGQKRSNQLQAAV